MFCDPKNTHFHKQILHRRTNLRTRPFPCVAGGCGAGGGGKCSLPLCFMVQIASGVVFHRSQQGYFLTREPQVLGDYSLKLDSFEHILHFFSKYTSRRVLMRQLISKHIMNRRWTCQNISHECVCVTYVHVMCYSHTITGVIDWFLVRRRSSKTTEVTRP